MASTTALAYIVIGILAGLLGIVQGIENVKHPDPRSAAQRRAMRENCRSKGL